MTGADAAGRWERYRDPGYARLLAAARRSLERSGGDLSRKVSLAQPSEAERAAVIGVTGKYSGPGVRRIQVALAELDAAVRGGTGLSLVGLLEKLGPPVVNRPAEQALRSAARQSALAPVRASVLGEHAAWFRSWAEGIERDGTVTTLLGRGQAGTIAHAVAVVEFLESRTGDSPPIMLPTLAARVTGDTHALDHRTSLSTLVLRALSLRADVPRPTTAETRRDLWDRHDVIVDDLASRVLVLNLPADGAGLGEWLTGAARSGTPFYVTLHQLVTLPIAVEESVVHVCENPAVLRRAAGELGSASRPLICTEGRASTAFRRLADRIAAGGGRLRCHGDFDWPGVAMIADLVDRHGAEPWRMSATDYRAGLADHANPVDLSGKPGPTPWDPDLARAMRRHGTAIYEESVEAPLIADLADDTHPG